MQQILVLICLGVCGEEREELSSTPKAEGIYRIPRHSACNTVGTQKSIHGRVKDERVKGGKGERKGKSAEVEKVRGRRRI